MGNEKKYVVYMNWLSNELLKGSALFVLILLFNNCDDSFACYMSNEEIAAERGLSVRSVQRSLAELEALGYIERELLHDGFYNRKIKMTAKIYE